MCGIVGYTGAKGASELLLSSLELLEHRGYDSVGIACRDSETDEVCIQKCVGRVRDLRAECEANPVLSTCGIGHTRWATHGEPSDRNSHPHGGGSVTGAEFDANYYFDALTLDEFHTAFSDCWSRLNGLDGERIV